MQLNLELKPQIKPILEYINDPLLFHNDYEELQLKCNPLLVTRLGRWQDFFSNSYMKAPCIYSDMNFALLEAAKSNDIFKNQTAHEFNLSIAFFERLINSGIFLKINNLEAAKYLLNISLVFSKFPGMMIGSLNKAFDLVKEAITVDNLEKMFESLFIKYESPKLLVKHLNLLGLDEIGAFMHIQSGHNLRTYSNLPIKLSRKESYILLHKIPNHLSFRDNALKRTILASKLLNGTTADPFHLVTFLESSKIFETDLERFERDLQFWKQAFNKICQIRIIQRHIGITDFVDYMEYQKYVLNEAYTLKGRSISSIIRNIGQWDYGLLNYTKTYLNLKWRRKTEEDLIITSNNTEYLFKELTTGQELFEETQKLNHCVYTYAPHCVKGIRAVWSMRKITKKNHKSLLTIEVRDEEIVQISGKHNREMTEPEAILVNDWAETIGYEISSLIC